MATVVITFFLFAPFYVYKMDADYMGSQGDQDLFRREKRWSMNSQRLEEIVAELMKPISDVRHSFDTDLCALLEEYLTEAGLHALDADAAPPEPAPNFAELALLLQQSASIYGRKVDFLYRHVLSVSDSLHNGTQESESASAGEQPSAGGAAGRRRRRSSAGGAFADIALERSAAAAREEQAPRPPPVLPRMYLELEPRQLDAADAPLLDYAAEPVGLLADFHVVWRLHEGLLVDELEGGAAGGGSPRPLSLLELQAAVAANSPPPRPAPAAESSEPPPSPPPDPLPRPEEPRAEPRPTLNGRRKRRSDVRIDDVIGGSVKIVIGKELRGELSAAREFAPPAAWVARVLAARARHIRARRRQRSPTPPGADFQGFDLSVARDVGGFAGWSSASAPTRPPEGGRGGDAAADSDDDGFFERSSLGDSDASRTDEPPARAGLDVRALGGGVLRALAAAGGRLAAPRLLAGARGREDVSRLLLASLFLANAGNVEMVQGPPLSVNSFSLRLLSTDERLYCAAAADERFLR